MSVSRRAIHILRPSLIATRTLASTNPPSPAPSEKNPAKTVNNDPYPVPRPVFPAPKDPWDVEINSESTTVKAAPSESSTGGVTPDKPKYSETQLKIVRGLARMMGYNSRASTAIRETGRMMGGIVDAIERDAEFWYDECRLPPTYQTFFQLHLLYILVLLPRLRALPATLSTAPSPIPGPMTPSSPQSPHTSTSTPTPTTPPASSSPILSKPHYESYPYELISHFFELSETQMRRVLGRGERERVVKKYMSEIGEQWKGAGVGMDFVLGLQSSEDGEMRNVSDVELASMLWRNLFGSKGLGAPTPGLVDPADISDGPFVSNDIDLPQHLETVVRFVRREMARLDTLEDADILKGDIGTWGLVKAGNVTA